MHTLTDRHCVKHGLRDTEIHIDKCFIIVRLTLINLPFVVKKEKYATMNIIINSMESMEKEPTSQSASKREGKSVSQSSATMTAAAKGRRRCDQLVYFLLLY